MRALVTGGAGFIGSHICERLLIDGFDVVCMDNFITGDVSNISSIEDNSRFTLIEHDVSEKITFGGEIDWVLHFACPASPIDYLKYPIQTLKVDSLGTLNTLGLAKAKKASYMLASTSEVYGDPKVHPQPESYWGNVNPVGPRSVYDEAKRFSEALAMAYHNTHGMDTRIVRIFNTYGPRMRAEDGRAVPTFISQALLGAPITVYGRGTQTRSFCYISDQIDGIRSLMESSYNMPVNIGNPQEYDMLGLAKLIMELTGSESEIAYEPLPPDDPKRRRPDISLAAELLGFSPKVGVRQGLAKTIEYFRSKKIPGGAYDR